MAYARQTDASKIVAGEGAMVLRTKLGATVEAGELIELQSDGFWDPAVGTGVITTKLRMAIEDGIAGDTIAAVALGRVVNAATGGTPGATLYLSDTAGEPAEAAGTKGYIAGHVENATDVFIAPQTKDFI